MTNQYGEQAPDDQQPYSAYGQGGQPGYGQGGQPGYGSGQPGGSYGQGGPYGQTGQPYGPPPTGYQAGPAGQPGGYAYGAQPYAGWLTRVGAYLLDGLPAWILIVIARLFAAHGGAGAAIAVVFYLASLGWIVYNRWIRAGRTGQSLGKSATDIRLIGESTGQPIGAGMAFVRDIAHIVDAVICYVGFLFPLWDSKKQTLADKIVNTVVVKNEYAPAQGNQQPPGGYGAPR